MKAYEIIVKGDVQGVFYRHYTKKEAQKHSLSGWCHNELDGSVKIFVQGGEEELKLFVDWAKEGSPMATVSEIKVNECKIDKNIKGFEIR